jgi:hypothetical protein
MPVAPPPRAKPAKIRYFPGRAPQGAPATSDTDSDDEEDEQIVKPTPAKHDDSSVAGGAGRVVQIGEMAAKGTMKLALRDVKVENGRVLIGGEDKAAGMSASPTVGFELIEKYRIIFGRGRD